MVEKIRRCVTANISCVFFCGSTVSSYVRHCNGSITTLVTLYVNAFGDIVWVYMVTGQGTGSRKLAVSTAVVDRLRRRLRSNGFRAHLTLQMVPEGDDLISNVHITPLRASRALALRYIANKFNLDMERVTVGWPTMLQCS